MNLQPDQKTIDEAINKKTKKADVKFVKSESEKRMDGAIPAKEAEPGTLKTTLPETPSILKMTEKTFSCNNNKDETQITSLIEIPEEHNDKASISENNLENSFKIEEGVSKLNLNKNEPSNKKIKESSNSWTPTSEWISSWKSKLPLQTIMRLLQVLVPQVEKICVDKGLTDESEILKFLQNGTLVGLLPVPHPILIRKYQPNLGTIMWLKTYMWGVIYLRLIIINKLFFLKQTKFEKSVQQNLFCIKKYQNLFFSS